MEFGIGARVPNASKMGLPDGRKKLGLVVLIDTIPAMTASQPATLPLYAIASRLTRHKFSQASRLQQKIRLGGLRVRGWELTPTVVSHRVICDAKYNCT